MWCAIALYSLPPFQDFTGLQSTYVVVTLSTVVAFLKFSWLEYRAHEGHSIVLVRGELDPEEIRRQIRLVGQEKRLRFVVLVGDSEQIPTLKGKNEQADSDPCYVKLAGDDNVMDAFISRISAENA
mgnify:CR=1 FL=1